MKNLGNRIKKYEKINKSYLLPNSYACLRIDGKAHHTYCRGLDRPFDDRYIAAMTEASKRLCKEVQGFELGYQQSDEFSLVFSDKRSQDACLWFGGNIQKINSVAASIFTLTFNQYMINNFGITKPAYFDCRVFNVPDVDIANALVWRQRDWERNSLQMFARSFFSHKKLMNKNHSQIHEMLHNIGENWSKLPNYLKNGNLFLRDSSVYCEKFDYEFINKKLNEQMAETS